jgi:hypothetical protein
MRESCLSCTRKHLAQAHILLQEYLAGGYWHHFWYAVGHLAEAEEESFNEYPEFSIKILEARRKIMRRESNGIEIESLIIEACLLSGDDPSLWDSKASKTFDIVENLKKGD